MVLAAELLGCSSEADERPTAREDGPAQTFISLERQTTARRPLEPSATALVGVLRTHAGVDLRRVARLVGLDREAPPLGGCEVLSLEESQVLASGDIERVDFLEVGDVTLRTPGRTVRLARQAYPTVTDFVAGVLYTSRDKTALDIPAGASYELRAAGVSITSPLRVTADAPEELEWARVDGLPLADVERVSLGAGIELSWQAGASGDQLWLSVHPADSGKLLRCAFDDALGTARVPAGMITARASASLELHRRRYRVFSRPSGETTELRFDFAWLHSVTLD